MKLYSICWTCKNARANICPWIGEGKKIWSRAKSAKRKLLKSKQKQGKEHYTVYAVEECQYFKPEDKRKTVVAL
jgi:hypothetical protein